MNTTLNEVGNTGTNLELTDAEVASALLETLEGDTTVEHLAAEDAAEKKQTKKEMAAEKRRVKAAEKAAAKQAAADVAAAAAASAPRQTSGRKADLPKFTRSEIGRWPREGSISHLICTEGSTPEGIKLSRIMQVLKDSGKTSTVQYSKSWPQQSYLGKVYGFGCKAVELDTEIETGVLDVLYMVTKPKKFAPPKERAARKSGTSSMSATTSDISRPDTSPVAKVSPVATDAPSASVDV